MKFENLPIEVQVVGAELFKELLLKKERPTMASACEIAEAIREGFNDIYSTSTPEEKTARDQAESLYDAFLTANKVQFLNYPHHDVAALQRAIENISEPTAVIFLSPGISPGDFGSLKA